MTPPIAVIPNIAERVRRMVNAIGEGSLSSEKVKGLCCCCCCCLLLLLLLLLKKRGLVEENVGREDRCKDRSCC